jgi:hypothetical protein
LDLRYARFGGRNSFSSSSLSSSLYAELERRSSISRSSLSPSGDAAATAAYVAESAATVVIIVPRIQYVI